MKINLNFEYDKLHLKEITILIPKYHPNMVSFLTPILGLYGINVKEFINDFEEKTKFINFDVIVPTRVRISKIKTFQIYIKTPYIVPILSNVSGFSLTKPSLDVLTFYKVCLIKGLFSSYSLSNFQKITYVSIRKYISSLLKVSSTVSVKKPIFIDANFNLNLLSLKKSLNNFLSIKKLVFNKFGVYLTFNNLNNSYLNYLRSALSLFNISLQKVKPKLLNSIVSKNYFYNNVLYLSSTNFNYMFNFFKQTGLKSFSSSLFICYYRIGQNLLPTSFFKSFFSSFSGFKPIYLFNTISFIFFKSLRLASSLNIRILRLINYNANLSSNIQKS